VFARALFAENMDIVQSCLKHPFVVGIASGALPRYKFVYYMSQDAFYLTAYVRAFALGIAKSPDERAMRMFKSQVDATFEELKLHISYSLEWGFPLDAVPAKATLNYTDFLGRAAAFDDISCIAAATLPCSILYGYLGTELSKEFDPATPYRSWIDVYSSAEFQAGTKVLESLINEYKVDENKIRRHYRRAMELEYDFFDAAYKSTDTSTNG
jgi:thiaminase/transcriptional activator TenA